MNANSTKPESESDESESEKCEKCGNNATHTVAGHNPGGNVRWQYDCCSDHLPSYTPYAGAHKNRIRDKCVRKGGYFVYTISDYDLVGTSATA